MPTNKYLDTESLRAVRTYVEGKVGALEGSSDSAVVSGSNKNEKITLHTISESDGVISQGSAINKAVTYTDNAIDSKLGEKIDKRTSGNEVYTHSDGTQGGIIYTTEAMVDTIVERTTNGNIILPTKDKMTSNNYAVSKDYVDTYGGKIDTISINGISQTILNKDVNILVDGTYNSSTNKIATQSTISNAINALNHNLVGGNGKYIRDIKQENGLITSHEASFDSTIPATNDSPSTITAPTTKAVRDAIDALNKAEEGSDGYYLKKIKEENGIITATKQIFDTDTTFASATNNNAPTSLAIKTYVDNAVSTNSANFIGTFENITALNAYVGTITNNDYAFVLNQVLPTDYVDFNALDIVDKTTLSNFDYGWVINGSKFDLYRFDIVNQVWELKAQNVTKDSVTLNTAYNRYKAIVSSGVTTWVYEYTLNSTTFNNSQWNAINSGATEELINKINPSLKNIQYKEVSGVKKFTQTDNTNTEREIVTLATLKSDMALNNVDNTSDLNKPISTATQTALDGKVPTTRTVNGHALSSNVTIDKSDVGLGNVDNTSDADKPISTATQSALDLKADKIGALPKYGDIDEGTNVVNFLNTNNLWYKPFIFNYRGACYCAIFNPSGPTTGSFEIEYIGGDARYVAYAVNLDVSIGNIINNTYKEDYEISNHKVSSISSSSTEAEYPSAKCVYDNIQKVREVAEGKCETFVLSYETTIASVKSVAQSYGQSIFFYVWNKTTKQWENKRNELVNGDYDNLSIINSEFNSNNDTINVIGGDNFLICGLNVEAGSKFYLLRTNGNDYPLHIGDIFLVKEVDVPDRWLSKLGLFEKLETAKIDLQNALESFGGYSLYDETSTYAVGDIVLKDSKLYRCNTAITQAEEWDSAHWTQISIKDLLDEKASLSSDNTFTGQNTFSKLYLSNDMNAGDQTITNVYSINVRNINFSNTITPTVDNSKDIGSSIRRIKNIYMSGAFNPNSSGYGFALPSSGGLTANSELLDSASAQTILGQKTFAEKVITHGIEQVSGSFTLGKAGYDIIASGTLRPSVNNLKDLGSSSYKWKDLYLSGQFKDGNNATYGLILPNTTSFTANKEIATTDSLPQIKRFI